jgi:hypothetical protein
LLSGLRHERFRLIAFETRDPSDPTSPRREASLFDSPRKPCVFGAFFYLAIGLVGHWWGTTRVLAMHGLHGALKDGPLSMVGLSWRHGR